MFVGDTLFAMGCGRLFEGTAEQMFANLQRLAGLPDDVQVYCGHEYTLANARFAVTSSRTIAALAERLARVEAARERGEVTLADDDRRGARHQPLHARRGASRNLPGCAALKDSFG